MSLDLTKIAAQIGGMVSKLKEGGKERQEHLDKALGIVNDAALDLSALSQKIALSKTTWLVAELVEGLNRCYPPMSLPADFTVVASDGSHIDVDRHRSARCYLINTGEVVLHYGPAPYAVLESTPRLYSDDADLVISPPQGTVREQVIEGNLLGIKRSVEECLCLKRLLESVPSQPPALGLLDGTLILWGLEGFPDFVSEALLDKGMLSCLDEIKQMAEERELAIASYISYPRSTDVVNVLRLAICPFNPADCDRNCGGRKEKECDAVSGVRDMDVFADLLKEGERSALFISPSKIQKQYGKHKIYFFYLKSAEEIARVEVPEWVALDKNRLNLTHTLILDQCRRGSGYPVALSEAHEQAVVTGADRENFWQVVESSLVEEKMPASTSAKSQSKRTRWV